MRGVGVRRVGRVGRWESGEGGGRGRGGGERSLPTVYSTERSVTTRLGGVVHLPKRCCC